MQTLSEAQCQWRIKRWLLEDNLRMQALITAEKLQLPQWMIAAGFVRNLVWDRLHGAAQHALADIDLIFYQANILIQQQDLDYEMQLKRDGCLRGYDLPWSVKNQARMHQKNGDDAYSSTIDAMSYWPEKETAVGVSLKREDLSASVTLEDIHIHSVFGCRELFALTLTHNPKRSISTFKRRVEQKNWLQRYPQLTVVSQS